MHWPHAAKQKGRQQKDNNDKRFRMLPLSVLDKMEQKRVTPLFCSILISLDRLPRSDPLLERDTFSGHNSPFPI